MKVNAIFFLEGDRTLDRRCDRSAFFPKTKSRLLKVIYLVWSKQMHSYCNHLYLLSRMFVRRAFPRVTRGSSTVLPD